MELKDITRKFERKDVRINLRTTKSNRDYLKKKKISPQLLFDVALEEFKEKNE